MPDDAHNWSSSLRWGFEKEGTFRGTEKAMARGSSCSNGCSKGKEESGKLGIRRTAISSQQGEFVRSAISWSERGFAGEGEVLYLMSAIPESWRN